MWHSTHLHKPRPGSRIIAVYYDGSGANLFIVVDDKQGGLRLIDQDGEETSFEYLADADYSEWAYLPDGKRLWCEKRADDPITVAA